jgi:8-oxo-dGTP pyrophosphatase MutT (NUDIX family)
MRDRIRQLIGSIRPFDDLEAEHIANAVAWIDSGVEIFRIGKPATPPKHLVSYFVLIDPRRQKVLLVNHIKAGLWLPAGGHVEKDEHPNATVEREIREELSIAADFASADPLFITQTVTVGMTAGHTDISLWYVLKADSEKEIAYDPQEFSGYRWFAYDDVLGADIATLDPHMHRFARKLFASDLVRT